MAPYQKRSSPWRFTGKPEVDCCYQAIAPTSRPHRIQFGGKQGHEHVGSGNRCLLSHTRLCGFARFFDVGLDPMGPSAEGTICPLDAVLAWLHSCHSISSARSVGSGLLPGSRRVPVLRSTAHEDLWSRGLVVARWTRTRHGWLVAKECAALARTCLCDCDACVLGGRGCG